MTGPHATNAPFAKVRVGSGVRGRRFDDVPAGADAACIEQNALERDFAGGGLCTPGAACRHRLLAGPRGARLPPRVGPVGELLSGTVGHATSVGDGA